MCTSKNNVKIVILESNRTKMGCSYIKAAGLSNNFKEGSRMSFIEID